MGCFQLKDRVQIACNLCHIPISFQGKVRNDDEFYWIYTFLGIAAGEVEHLSLTGPPVKLWDCKGGATSWIRRCERNWNQSKKPSREGLSTVLSLTPEFLELDLYVIKAIPTRRSPQALSLSKSVLESGILAQKKETNFPFGFLNSMKSLMLGSSLSTILSKHLLGAVPQNWVYESTHRPLAVAIDCGLDWIKDIMGVLCEEVIGSQEFGPFDNQDELQNVAEFLVDSIARHVEAAVHHLKKIYLQPMLEFLAFNTDGRFRSFTNLGSLAVHVSSGPKNNKAVLKGIPPQFFLAMPACLAA